MIDNLFVISATGEVLLEKHWRNRMKRTICELFWEEVNKIPGSTGAGRFELLPIFATPKCYMIATYRFGLFWLTCVAKEVQPLLVLETHARIVDVLVQYFSDGRLNESILRENFSTVLQVLDEMVDGGFPSTTELNTLKDMIVPPSLAQRVLQSVTGDFALGEQLPQGAVSKIPWRKADVKYVTNEIYFDLCEQVDALIAPNGNPVSINVYGDIRTNCRLSGMPDLTLTFVNPRFMEDCALHRCVRINRFERERVVSFVPPDGQFTLLSYRVKGIQQLPLHVRPQITYRQGGGRVYVQIQPRYTQDKAITDVVIHIPFPKHTKAANLTASQGSVKHDPLTKLLRWDVGVLQDGKQPVLEGSIQLPPDFVPDEAPTVTAEFTIKMFCISGLKVDGLQIKGVKYKPFKGVRSVTQAGKFQLRCA